MVVFVICDVMLSVLRVHGVFSFVVMVVIVVVTAGVVLSVSRVRGDLAPGKCTTLKVRE